jgi:hypothetical protein
MLKLVRGIYPKKQMQKYKKLSTIPHIYKLKVFILPIELN